MSNRSCGVVRDHFLNASRADAIAFEMVTNSPQERFDILDARGNEILARKEELGRQLSREQGKPLADAMGEAHGGAIFKYSPARRCGSAATSSIRFARASRSR